MISLVDVLQMLAQGGRTGRLALDHPKGQASVWLQDGGIVHAEFDGHGGKNALFALLADESGTYAFDDGERAPRRSIRDAVDELLLDAIRRTDQVRGRTRSVKDTYIGDAVPAVVVDPSVSDSLELQPEELAFLRYVDGKRSVGEAAAMASLDPLAVRHVISRLLHVGALKVRQRRPRTARLVTRLDQTSSLPLGTAGVDQSILKNWEQALGYVPREIMCRGHDSKVHRFPVRGQRKIGPFLQLSRDTLLRNNLAADTAMLVRPVSETLGSTNNMPRETE